MANADTEDIAFLVVGDPLGYGLEFIFHLGMNSSVRCLTLRHLIIIIVKIIFVFLTLYSKTKS